MKVNKKLYGLCVGMACLISLSSCQSTSTFVRKDGFDRSWRGFDLIPKTPGLYKEVDIKFKIIVVDDFTKTGYFGAAGTYSYPDNVIRIVGKVVDGKIVVPDCVLGHEVMHGLQFQIGGEFINPDKLEEYGY
jgi:hypothetical protein